MTAGPATRARPQDELAALAVPLVERVTAHPFWAGLRDGTLPPEALWWFAEQDARYVVPAYARALARCAAGADRMEHAGLLAGAAQATVGSLPRLDRELGRLAETLGRTAGSAPAGPGPAVHAYTSVMLAAPVTSFAAGVGALLPMSWFHLLVSDDLRRRADRSSRYGPWIEQYLAYDGFADYVAAWLAMVDEVVEAGGDGNRTRLVEWFLTGARCEWEFADAAWRRQGWAV
ncbi:TenA family protein [Micromonospora thermarum]|uniref:TenA family transcriptional regulator n=1 Tax=Micromonospora thermarum TaxID=2720024 RepID=A0ABX0Z793_9ACTN|nr:TenA family transcriptional regulator [Micromonospora thermarum]NJP33343.1 TenA family transcriptional regulator [Micromonospora thermarum]